MTPAARAAAAIAILDAWSPSPEQAPEAVEAALTRWARGARYAGSSDREAVRDLVFTAVRRARSSAAYGGGEGGRARLLGLAREALALGEPAPWIEGWMGEGHAPAPLSAEEEALVKTGLPSDLLEPVRLDQQDWLYPLLASGLGADRLGALELLRHRAPIFVRVNRAGASLAEARDALSAEGIGSEPHPLATTALELTSGARKLRNGAAYRGGLVELQDAASQAVVEAFAKALPEGRHRVLDYCAGGGGKALGLAALGHKVTAHDIDIQRMQDIPERAERAGVRIALEANPKPGWPALLADAPCSGSGSWRRAPEAKWRLTAERLAELNRIQSSILELASELVETGGIMGYATCSMLACENEERTAAFLAAHPNWQSLYRLSLTPLDGGDGFFLEILRRMA